MPSQGHHIFSAIGTSWDIHIPGGPSAQVDAAIAAAKERIAQFDTSYSRFRDDSLVTEMSRAAGTYELPADAEPMFALYEKLYRITRGKVTPLIGQVISDAGYDASYSLEPKPVIASARAWEDVMRRSGRTLTLLEPALLDLGALGKGYLIDIVGAVLTDHGIHSFTINAGGDILYRSAAGEKLRIGLEDPADPARAIGVAEIASGGICGSAGNRRAWKGFHHIIDPHTVTSPVHIKALWVSAETTLLADGLATALFFAEPEALEAHFRFGYAILYADGTGRISPSFPGTFFQE